MIVRIMGVGQWEVPEELVIKLNVLDELVSDAVVFRDQYGLAAALEEMGDLVARYGTPLPAGRVRLSDLIVPSSDASMDEISEWLQESYAEEGLIPG